eukprot:SAG31_NODE_567_length_14028_cov_4.022328_2_plen_210_part_00
MADSRRSLWLTASLLCRWLDDCCRPIELAIGSLLNERSAFVALAALEMEASAPELISRMLEQSKVGGFAASADGTQAISVRSQGVYWDQATRPTGLTHACERISETFDSCAAYVLANADIAFYTSKPYARPLPAGILECIAADPTAPFASRFRHFVRCSFLYRLEQVSQLLEAHAAVVEAPPTEWCACLYHVLRQRVAALSKRLGAVVD